MKEETPPAAAPERATPALAPEDPAGHVASLRKAVKERTTLLTTASRELRNALTPVASMVEYLETSLARGADSREQLRPAVRQLGEATLHLSRRATLLCEASRFLAGHAFHPTIATIDLSRMLGDLVEATARFAEISAIRLLTSIERDVIVLSDRAALDLVMHTLISNAVRYGAGHPISIALSYLRDREEHERVQLVVRDQGIGIASGDLERIFEPFHAMGGAASPGGFGVGLFTSRKLVEALGGRIAVESTLGLGSTFTVTLPLCIRQ